MRGHTAQVIPDDEEDIIATTRAMVDKYDLVITSGGIGPSTSLPLFRARW